MQTNHSSTLVTGYAGETRSGESHYSGVSWSAVFAGAVAATASVLIMLSIGAGLGLAAVSPWKNDGASAGAIGVSMVIGLIVVQWLSAAFGGYIAGRLRTKWAHLHADETYFRDTAHGFLSWALGAVLGVVLLASATGSVIGAAGSAAGGVANAAGHGAMMAGAHGDKIGGWMDENGYSVDSLLRSNKVDARPLTPDERHEATRILMTSVKNEGIAPDDKTYLAGVISSRSDLSQAEAEAKIDDTVAKLKEAEVKARAAADEARKQAAKLAMYNALAMLIGAFVASAAAVLGGRHRDLY